MPETRGLRVYSREALEAPRLQSQPEKSGDERLKEAQENRKKVLADRLERKTTESEIKDLEKEIEGGGKTESGDQTTTVKTEGQKSEKKYIVDAETGDIQDVGEDGELTYKEALTQAANIKSKQGRFDEFVKAVSQIKNLFGEGDKNKGFWLDDEGNIQYDPEGGELTLSQARIMSEQRRKKAPQEPKKEWDVDDETGELIKDPEGGQYTFAEAKAVSNSKRKALQPKDEDKLTSKDLEIYKKDQEMEREKLRKEFGEMLDSIVEKIPRPKSLWDNLIELGENYDKLPPIIRGYIDTLLGGGKDKGNLYPVDEKGNLMPLTDFLEMQKFKRDEDRKDRRENALVSFIERGKEELPAIVEGFKEMVGKKESGLSGTEWGEENKTEEPSEEEKRKARETVEKVKGRLTEIKCDAPGCDAVITTLDNAKIAVCDQCGAINFIGTREEFDRFRSSLISQMTATGESGEKTAEGEYRESGSEESGTEESGERKPAEVGE